MSGIYIRGMEMPEACTLCPCARNYGVCEITNKHPSYLEWVGNKPSWCPLVEVTQVDFDLFLEGRVKPFTIPSQKHNNES